MIMKTLHHNTMLFSLTLVITLIVLTPFQAVSAAETFTMAFFETPEKEPLLRFAELVYIEAFQRLGLEFTYAVYPQKRCGVLVNAGEVDGEPGRVGNHNQTFPNLIRVEEPIVEVKMAAFAIDPSISLDGWESLQGTTYNVEYIIGGTDTEDNLPKFVDPERLSKVATVEQALKKLRAGRTDIFIHAEELVLSVLRTEEFKDSGIVKVGLMQDHSAYPFLYKKHADIAPKLAAVLKQMKAEGLYAQYWEQAMQGK
jgi:hypothetical protein